MGGITKSIGKITKGIGGAVGGVAGNIFGSDGLSGVTDTLFGATDKLFGNNIPNELKDPRLTSFTAPGLSATYLSPEQLELQRSPETSAALAGLSSAFAGEDAELGRLQSMVEPGFGRLTEAGIRAVRDARRSSMGDLRQNLARRRVLGSSFGADDINRTNAEFARRENEVASEAFVKELALSNELIKEKALTQAKPFLAELEQLNLESATATQMATGVSTILSNNANAIAQMSNSGADRILNVGGTALGFGLGGPFRR